jgi:hypothetical protein
MDRNQQSSADHIIEHLNEIDVDGETMQYIIDGIGLRNQILKQLIMESNDFIINQIMAERDEFHDKGKNNHLN